MFDIYALLVRMYLNDWNKLGRYCGSRLKVVTLVLKFSVAVITHVM